MAQNTWAMHYQSVWEERAADPAYPMWCRVAWLAFARHKTNGHANFERGQLSQIFGKFSHDGFTPLDANNLQRYIRGAKKAGLLDRSSCAECLVVPSHAIQGGWGGSVDSPCPVHDRKSAHRKLSTTKVGQELTHVRCQSGSKSNPSSGSKSDPYATR